MKPLTSFAVKLERGETARLMSQKAVLPVHHIVPEFKEKLVAEAVQRLSYILYESFGEPSFLCEKNDDGPVLIWIVSLKHSNGIISFELWLLTQNPKCHIFIDRNTPLVITLLQRIWRSINSPFTII